MSGDGERKRMSGRLMRAGEHAQGQDYSTAVWSADFITKGRGTTSEEYPEANRRDHAPVYLAPLRSQVERILVKLVMEKTNASGVALGGMVVVKGGACSGKSVLMARLVHHLKALSASPKALSLSSRTGKILGSRSSASK